MKRLPTSLTALVAALLLVGCSPGDPLTGKAASDLPPGPLQPLPSDSVTPKAPDCTVLTVGRGDTRSEDDADFLVITFTNEGDADCTVHGFPTLTMRNSKGRNMGERAVLRSNGAARYLRLKPGGSATATVRYPKVETCTAGTVRIEVLIPGATRRDFIDESHPYCPGWTVSEIRRPFN